MGYRLSNYYAYLSRCKQLSVLEVFVHFVKTVNWTPSWASNTDCYFLKWFRPVFLTNAFIHQMFWQWIDPIIFYQLTALSWCSRFCSKLTFKKFYANIFCFGTNFCIANKMELTLITHKESSEMENFAFYFLLTNFNFKIVSLNLVAKNGAQRKLRTLWNHANVVVNLKIPSIVNALKMHLKAF